MSKNRSLKQNKTNFKDLLNKLDIDETLTKSNHKQKHYNKFINSIVPEANFNYMSDLLQLPETSQGYKYLFVIMDLATNKFDIEPMKNNKAITAVKSLKSIIQRGILKLPEISIKTDNGSEFKGIFDDYLKKQNIYHSFSTPYRKTQMAPVERLNKELGRLIMNYLNTMEIKTNHIYKNWIKIIPTIRKDLNKFRERSITKLKKVQDESYFDTTKKPQFDIGELVHYKLMKPTTIRGHKINDIKFREGDRQFSIDRRKIKTILYYPDEPWYRYKLEGLPHISFNNLELKKSSIQEDETAYIVKQIIGQKVEKKIKYYLVWWKGYLKKEATWEPKNNLIKDGLQDYIDKFEKK
jgi:hypothetical protein